MTAKNTAILTSVVLVGIGLYVVNGYVPDSPATINRVCARVLLSLDCADAQRLARDAADVPCVEGDVGVWVEVVGHKAWDEPLVLTDWLPANVAEQVSKRVQVWDDTARVINCAQAKRPSKVITPLKWVEVDTSEYCIAGCVSRDTSEHADGSQWRQWHHAWACCEDEPGKTRCRCDDPPCVPVPPRNDSWQARLAEQRPGLVCP
jgi:hypothetical protein